MFLCRFETGKKNFPEHWTNINPRQCVRFNINMPINVATMCAWTLTGYLNKFTGNLPAFVCIFSIELFCIWNLRLCKQQHNNFDWLLRVCFHFKSSANSTSNIALEKDELLFPLISNCGRLFLTMFIYLWRIYFDVLRKRRKIKSRNTPKACAFNAVSGFPVPAFLPSYLKFSFVNLIPFRIGA